MHDRPRRLRRGLLITLVAMGIGACTTTPSPTTPSGPSSAEFEARRLYAEQQYAGAAEAFLALAASRGDAGEKLSLLLAAADAAALAENPQLLASALEEIRPLPRDARSESRLLLHRAEMMILLGQPRAALDQLPEQPPGNDPALAARHLFAVALARRELGDGAAAISTLVMRNSWLRGRDIAANNDLIWRWLLDSDNFIAADPGEQTDFHTAGWLALGRIARSLWREPEALTAALDSWRESYAGHPAMGRWVLAAEDHVRELLLSPPQRIALLLPLSGPYAEPAAAIRDGFFAAYYRSGAAALSDSTITVYDSSIDPAQSYNLALTEGAEIIVGPLDKPGVSEIARQIYGDVPVLALNYLDEAELAPPNLYQFGLAPEDEAVAAATRALDDGFNQAIALISGADWARRSLSAFESTLNDAGGRILDVRILSDNVREYPAAIRDLLQLTESEARHRALENALGQTLEFEPTRRQDAQFVFLAASPDQAAQARPQFRFFHAIDLPIYASGRAYVGYADPRRDRDLDGMNLCLMPWLIDDDPDLSALRREINGHWPTREKRFARLYALGHDAFNLLSLVRSGNWREDQSFAAATGNLALRGTRIARQLPCAIFEDGRVRRLSAEDAQL